MNQNEYLSDEENDVNEDNEELIHVELDMYGMPIEQESDDEDEDELEYRRMLNEKLLSKSGNYDTLINKKSVNKNTNKVNNKNKALSLNDFNKLIDSKIESEKPKKFISKRTLEKKQTTESYTSTKRALPRQFTPKFGFVPYLLSEQYKNRRKN